MRQYKVVNPGDERGVTVSTRDSCSESISHGIQRLKGPISVPGSPLT